MGRGGAEVWGSGLGAKERFSYVNTAISYKRYAVIKQNNFVLN